MDNLIKLDDLLFEQSHMILLAVNVSQLLIGCFFNSVVDGLMWLSINGVTG